MTKSPSENPSRTSDGLVMVCDVDLATPDATRTHTVEVARGFAAEGLDVDLVARGPDPRIGGVRYHTGAGSTPTRAARLAGVNARALRVLWSRRRRARRCYVRHEWAQLPVLLGARALGYRLVTQVDDVAYGRGYQGKIGWVADCTRRLVTRAMGRLAAGVVAVTREIKAILVTDFGVPAERVAVLPNGVDLDAFRPRPRGEAIVRAGLDPGHEYVVFAGRFAWWVDFDVMLDAFASVAERRDGARLLLVGDGPERPHVERALGRLGLGDRVLCTGFVDERDRLVDYLGAATVVLSANTPAARARIGVSPLKIAEYFAAGRGVIATEMPGVREAVDSAGAGIVVPRDPAAMADAIVALLEDPARADELGAAGRRAAEERYSWRSIVQRTLPLFGD